MPRLSTLLRTVAATAAATALGGSLLTLAPAGSAAPADPSTRAVAQPAVGDCHRLSNAQVRAESDTEPPVDCGTSHNSLTVAVITLPADTDWTDTEKLWGKVATRCYRALNTALGRTAQARALSAYGLVWFIPTARQRDDGARWIRCDVVLHGRAALKPIAHKSPLLEQPLTDRVRRCLTESPYYTVVCADRHAFRSTGLVRMPFKAYPAKPKVQAFAERKCPARTSSDYWRYTYASKWGWKAGNRFLVCYTQTRR